MIAPVCFSSFSVIVTDLKEILHLISKNVADNETAVGGRVQVVELNWSEFKLIAKRFPKIDVILLADCIYYEEVMPASTKTIGLAVYIWSGTLRASSR
jgi:hypothetical protein